MSSLELNKIVGAVLVAGLVALTTGILADMLVQPETVEHAAAPADAAGEPAAEEGGAEAPGEEEVVPIAALLASADAAAGEGIAKRCAACHTFEKGGAAKVGPNLWGIVGAPRAHMEGFAYSDAIAGMGGNWDFESLSNFLASPKEFAPGTKMAFAGIKKPDDRANLLAYLHTLSDNPVPLPEAPPAAEAAPAEAVPTETDPGEAAPAGATGTVEPPAEGEGVPPADDQQQAAAPAGDAGGAAGGGGGIAGLLAAADVANGEKLSRRCAACHSFDKGGANKVGPNLWDIVGAEQAHLPEFNYSEALAGLDGTWTYDALDAWLASPKEYAPGNKMAFAGLKKPEDRADLIAWLRTLSDQPQPLP